MSHADTRHSPAPADAHDQDVQALGPIDVAAWGAGILGVGIAVVMAIAFVMATGNPA